MCNARQGVVLFQALLGNLFVFSAADILSAVSFDQSGEYFATGDRGGRVVIFKKSGGEAKVGAYDRKTWRRSDNFVHITPSKLHLLAHALLRHAQ